eukprot:360359-Rhodomonas_salina.1
MDTIYCMGTIVYVKNCNLPSGVTTVPCKFVYKAKLGDKGQMIKKKACLCLSSDLQNETEYNETFAPTSHFNTLRTLIYVATQELLKLVQFDIKGAFM